MDGDRFATPSGDPLFHSLLAQTFKKEMEVVM
jgi:hypothetical protein